MPTTSSPWARPSSPAGRRLLQSEPATADGIPVLDEATLALGAALVAASARPGAVPRPVLPAGPRPGPARDRARGGPAPASALGRRGLLAAALVTGLLAVGATAGLDRPAPAAPGAVAVAPLALGRAAGSVLDAETPAPVPGGRVVVGLIDPTAAVGAAPGDPAEPLARRLGALAALAVEDASGPRGPSAV